MKNKMTFSKELLFIFSNIFDASSGALMILAGFGNTPMGAFPLVLNEIFPSLTVGQMNFIVQVILLVLLMVIIRRFSVYYLMSFMAAFIYDVFLDLFIILFKDLPVNENLRVVYFVIALVAVAMGCGGYQHCDLPLMPFDICVRDLAKYTKKNHASIKLLIDCFFLLSAIVLSFTVLKKIMHVGIATVIVSFTNGTLISFFDSAFFSHLRFKMVTRSGKYLENLKAI